MYISSARDKPLPERVSHGYFFNRKIIEAGCAILRVFLRAVRHCGVHGTEATVGGVTVDCFLQGLGVTRGSTPPTPLQSKSMVLSY